jgi:8-oxo-dGTP pyrophosphatase MutT (NUDIX family)
VRSEPPGEPRLAATLLLLRDGPFEVLMVRRHARATFASALVFPGGALDADDADDSWLPLVTGADDLEPGERARRIAAARETWEETGILLGAADAGARDRSFRAALEAADGLLDLRSIVPFGHWITPIAEARRFDTHFYLAAAPVGQFATADGGETVDSEWIAPADAVRLAAERTILFPTLMNLGRLAEKTSVADALASARAHPVVAVQPVITLLDDGTRVISIPESSGYGTTEFRMPPAPDASHSTPTR